LLSASWSLYVSDRMPNELEVAERLIALVTAVMSLCDRGEPMDNDGAVFARWHRAASQLGAWDSDEPGLTKERVAALQARLRDVRNIAVHGSDAVLVNLRLPAGPAPPGARAAAGGQV
jgi:hypothetical protein